MIRRFYTCERCGETWESKMKTAPTVCATPLSVKSRDLCYAKVRPALPEEIEQYERMFVEW